MGIKQKAPKDIEKYEVHYSDSKFWNKTKSLGKNALRPALQLYYVMKSPDVPLKIKGTIAGALGYLILPTDLIPDFIAVLGFTDDVAALATVIKLCYNYITPEIKAQAETKLKEIFK